MGKKKTNKGQQGKMLGCMLDKELNKKLENVSLETGSTKAEITRRALRQFMVDGQDEAIIMLNLLKHVQMVRDMKDTLPKEQYDELMKYSNNILSIKGGDLHGYF